LAADPDKPERAPRPGHKELSPETLAMNKALFQAIDAANLSDRAIARELKFSPSVIGNVRRGESGTFSMGIWQRFRKRFPGLMINAALDPSRPGRTVKQIHLLPDGDILVHAETAAGLMRPGFALPPSQQTKITLPVGEADLARGAFAVVVRRPGAEELYAEGSILVCIPIAAIEPGELADGRRVIVQRSTDRGYEATVRQVRIEANEASLWWRSTHLSYQAPVRMPYIPGRPLRPWSDEGSRYRIVGVVIWRAGDDVWPTGRRT
jgi:hypothetical protein